MDVTTFEAKPVTRRRSSAKQTKNKEKKVQTAFRLPAGLLEQVKEEARRQGMSLNAFVENVLLEETRFEFPCIHRSSLITLADLFIEKESLPSPSENMLKTDSKLAYIWQKGA